MFTSPINLQTREIKIINKKTNEVEIIKQKTIIYAVIYARVMELVDMLDSKSGDFTVVWVRVPSLVKISKM